MLYNSTIKSIKERATMARTKITLTCKKCNCEFTHIHFSHNRKEADNYEQWAVENIAICPNCYKENKKEEENREISSLCEKLPELKGSDKQINWAVKIRADFYKKYVEVLNALTEKQKEESSKKISSLEKLFQNDSAKFWIENRNASFKELINQ